MEATPVWHSYHLHFAGDHFDQAGDEVLSETVGPMLDHWQAARSVRQFFFIRYSVDGPHVRLRILPWQPEAATNLEQEILQMAAASSLDLRPAEYVPETERYLGPALLGIGERVFQASSEFALAVIRGGKVPDRELRQGKALAAMVVMAHAFLRGRTEALAMWDRYATRYERRLGKGGDSGRERDVATLAETLVAHAPRLVDTVAGLIAALENDGPLPEPFETLLLRLRALARECRDELPSAGRWGAYRYPFYVFSQIHMHNNRLGIRPYEETELANRLSAIYRLLAHERS